MKNILIIDDDKDLCSLLERELKKENFNIIVCYDGQTGLDAFKTQNYQLVILDIMLPVMNGVWVQSRSSSVMSLLIGIRHHGPLSSPGLSSLVLWLRLKF